MRLYEVMILLPPETGEVKVDDKLRLVETLAQEAGGKVTQSDRRIRRRTAYPVGKHDEVFDMSVQFESNGSTNAELDRRLRLDTDVLRFLVVRLDEDYRYADKRARQREEARRKRKPKPEASRPEGGVAEAAAQPQEAQS
jgi:small subunit ribosomal protein S6